MKLVTDSEAQAREVKAQAQAQAKALTEQAQRSGEAMLAQAEAQGAEQTQATMKKYEQERDALKAAAAERLDQAAESIVGKVVRG